MAANVGDEPEPVEAERDQLKAGAARHEIEKPLRSPVNWGEAGNGGGTGTGGGVIGVQAN